MTSIEQIEIAYRRMATEGRYRPAAPSDGFGTITVPLEELDLDAAAAEYARRWWADEDEMTFWVGCCDFTTRPAVIFAIEAVRNLNAGHPGREVGLRLLRMAVEVVEKAG